MPGTGGAALRVLVEAAELIAARTRRPPPPPDAAERRLKAAPFTVQVQVLRAATILDIHPIVALTSFQVVALLRGRSADVLRVVLNAPDDLTGEEKRASLGEPLLAPPEDEAVAEDPLAFVHK